MSFCPKNLESAKLCYSRVPQGRVLSPLLFILYTNDCVSHHANSSLIRSTDDAALVGFEQSPNWSTGLGWTTFRTGVDFKHFKNKRNGDWFSGKRAPSILSLYRSWPLKMQSICISALRMTPNSSGLLIPWHNTPTHSSSYIEKETADTETPTLFYTTSVVTFAIQC